MRIFQALSSLFLFIIASCYPAPKAAGQFTNAEFNNMADEMAKGEAADISLNELLKIKEKVVLLDSREKKEYEVSHIPGAIWVGYDDFNLDRIKAFDQNTQFVVYCSVGYRSERVSEKIQNAGYRNVLNLKGSIFQWINEGHPVEDSNGNETMKIHGYNKKWSKWIKNGEIVY
jgi:rhodanese-related sulfurtransferase